MAAPERFAKRQILFPCTAGAVHTWHFSAVGDVCSNAGYWGISGSRVNPRAAVGRAPLSRRRTPPPMIILVIDSGTIAIPYPAASFVYVSDAAEG
jgi:hypothetical protein